MQYLLALCLVAAAAAVPPARLTGAPAPLVVPASPAEAVKVAGVYEQVAASELETIRIQLPVIVESVMIASLPVASVEAVKVADLPAASVEAVKIAEPKETVEAVKVAAIAPEEIWKLARETVEAVKIAELPAASVEAVKIAELPTPSVEAVKVAEPLKENVEAVKVAATVPEDVWKLARDTVEAVKIAELPAASVEAVKVASFVPVAGAQGEAVKVAILPKYTNPLLR